MEGTFEEWGNLPAEKEEKSPQMFRLVQNIRAGLSTTEIIDDNPGLAFRVREIDLLRQTLTAEKYAVENRPLEVTYLYGASGTGKTWGIYQKHEAKNICCITNLPLEKQYHTEQWERPETWRAFLRRIHNIIEYLSDGSTVIHKKGGFP